MILRIFRSFDRIFRAHDFKNPRQFHLVIARSPLFECFADQPEAFVYGRASLPEAAAARRAKREAGWRPTADWNTGGTPVIGAVAGFLAACVTFRRAKPAPGAGRD